MIFKKIIYSNYYNLRLLFTYFLTKSKKLIYIMKITNLGIVKHDLENSQQLIQELRDKFAEDSAKLINQAACCFMGKKEFEKAELTLEKLYKFYNENPNQMNSLEFGTALKNLIIVSTVLMREESKILEFIGKLGKLSANDVLLRKMDWAQSEIAKQ